MKRKIFFQVSVLLYIILALFLAIMAAAVYIIIEFFNSMIQTASSLEWAAFIAAIGGFFFIGYTFIRFARNRIILNNEEIYVPEHWGKKDNKIQYETHIAYTEVEKIFLIRTDKNSLNKAARWIFTPMPYIIFDCKDDMQKAINVFYYSKKQVIKIIDEAILRAKKLGNELQIKPGAEIVAEFNKAEKEAYKDLLREIFKNKKK